MEVKELIHRKRLHLVAIFKNNLHSGAQIYTILKTLYKETPKS
jgi:hypothetical protein